MTMRLDIVTNDAGEGVRREHARELGAGVVIAIYRLAKLAQVHDLQNQAFTRQLEQTHQIIGDYGLRSGSNVNVMFAHKAVFVAGQLLKGSRATYEMASELGDLFERMGGSDLFIQRDLTREELMAFAEQISQSYRTVGGTFRSPTPKIRLRQVADSARLRGLELEELSADQRIVRMYASAVVIMRRFFEDLQSSRYILPRRIKRIAQSLVDLSDGSTPAFLGVTEVRNANFDEAGRAVNTAILAVSMAREVTQDRAILSQIAMAGMMHDVARPRAMALSQASGPAMPGMAGPTTLSEDQEDRLAAGAAAVLTALGRVNEPSITRTVLTFEALWLRRQTWLGPVYWGARAPTLHAKLIAIARRYNDLLTPEPGLLPPTPDYAIAALSEELKEPSDRTVLRMLVSALGLLPMGTVVQLATGEVAEVVRGPKGPGEKPRVRLVMDANGQQLQPVEIELAQDPHRQVARIMAVDGWRKGLALGPGGGNDQDHFDPDADSKPPEARGALSAPPEPQFAAPAPLPAIAPVSPVAMAPPGGTAHAQATSRSIADQYADKYAGWSDDGNQEPARQESSSIQSGEHNSSASLPSMGSSPSAVAEAMGRMINDSLRPPSGGREAERTVMQASSDDTADRVTSRPARTGREPTARGNLAATPLPHVLVYMLDHSLTGSVVFEGGEGDDAIYFVDGVPTKVRLFDQVALLGQILVHGGAIETKAVEQAVEGARRLGILLGEYLVGHDLVSREALSWGLEAQLLNKIAYLANLPPEISYSYYRETDLLEGWGGGDVPVGCALNPILASVRNWMDRARIRATLNRIGKHPLVLHDDGALSNLALLPEEEATLDMIRVESLPLAQLFKREVADEEVVSSLVYTLAVTRQFAFKGQKKGPMASKQGAQWQAAVSTSNAPAASGAVAVEGHSAMPVSGAIVASMPSPSQQAQPAPVSLRGGTPAASAVQARGQAPASDPARAPGANVPVSVRKPAPAPAPAAAQAAQPPPQGQRAMAPAARPPAAGLPRANPPQIRPIPAKQQGTIVGLQPAEPRSARQAPAPHGAGPAQGAAADRGAQGPPDLELGSGLGAPRAAALTPPDGMKTIARPAPAFLMANAGRVAPAPAAGQPATGAPAPRPGVGAARPSPGLPSKVAPPRAGAPAQASPGQASPGQASFGQASPAFATKPAPKAPAAVTAALGGPARGLQGSPNPPLVAPSQPQATNGALSGDDIDVELDDGSSSMSNAIEIGDDGMADAEAALEAMQNFRLAEAALQRNDMANAHKLAQKAVDGDPTQADYVTLLAWVRSLGKNPQMVEEAIATMTQVLGDDPSNERALLYRGKLLARTNRFQEALADLTELLAGNPQNRDAQAELRSLKAKMG
jgi:HD-GYP domain-containing protein (c-di-GMP phosphodiesterase class II)